MKPFTSWQLELVAKLPTDIRAIGEQRSRDELWILAHAWYEWSNPKSPPILPGTQVETISISYNGEPDVLVHKGQLLTYKEREKNFVIDSITATADGFLVYVQWNKQIIFDQTMKIILPDVLSVPALLLTSATHLRNN